MRTSEALLLGSTMLKPLAGVYWNRSTNEGCAMGMISAAEGSVVDTIPAWMCKELASNLPYTLPCACKKLPPDAFIMGGGCQETLKYTLNTPHLITVHLFNYHVMTVKDWTIYQVADWLETVQPCDKEETENGHDHNGSACGDQDHREAAREKETSGAR